MSSLSIEECDIIEIIDPSVQQCPFFDCKNATSLILLIVHIDMYKVRMLETCIPGDPNFVFEGKRAKPFPQLVIWRRRVTFHDDEGVIQIYAEAPLSPLFYSGLKRLLKRLIVDKVKLNRLFTSPHDPNRVIYAIFKYLFNFTRQVILYVFQEAQKILVRHPQIYGR